MRFRCGSRRGPRASRWPQGNTCDETVRPATLIDIHLDIFGLDIEMFSHQPHEFFAQAFNRPLFETIAIVRQGHF
jgi:hypothetical protein